MSIFFDFISSINDRISSDVISAHLAKGKPWYSFEIAGIAID